MAFAIGLKAIRRLCETQSSIEWFKAKLTPQLFNPAELPVFQWVDEYVRKHHALPQLETLGQKFPEILDVQAIEPASYHIETLENSYFYQVVHQANLESAKLLKENPNAGMAAINIMRQAVNKAVQQQYRTKIMNFGEEAPLMVFHSYHDINAVKAVAGFGWPYMDDQGGLLPGEVVSFVGRPQAGKSWMSLFTALHNWRVKKLNTLVVSMEMGHLPIAQRLTTMIAGTNLTQLKKGYGHSESYSTVTYNKFVDAMAEVTALSAEEGAPKLYVVNGNLAADMEEIYVLADQLQCKVVVIDGAYLCRNKNPRLDRFTRAAENCEASKRYSEDLEVATFSSWQFNRDAAKKIKQAKNGGGKDGADIEDIGYSDAIGQISSIVLGLFQEDGIETIKQKTIRVLKGRGGEVGEFNINWSFTDMNFSQFGVVEKQAEPEMFADELI